MPPQYTYEGTKSPSHFASKTNIVPFFLYSPFYFDKIPRTPKFVKSKEKHPFRGDFLKNMRPTILQSYNSLFLHH